MASPSKTSTDSSYWGVLFAIMVASTLAMLLIASLQSSVSPALWGVVAVPTALVSWAWKKTG